MLSGRKIVANTLDPEEVRVAVLDERGKLHDIYIERIWEEQRTGEIYKAKVESILPGMNAAFLNLGDTRNAFLYLDDVKSDRSGKKSKTEKVVLNEEMIVQVVKSARKGKGARVTPRVSLAGRYCVLIPGGHETGVSRRIDDDTERGRLRGMARALHPKNCGLIIRTAAEGVEEENLAKDIGGLLQKWEEISHKASKNAAPCLLYKDMGLLERVLRDELLGEATEIVVDTEEERSWVVKYLAQNSFGTSAEVNLYTGTTPLFELYNIEKEIDEACGRKVWLSSGAYLVIEQTEALTVIDVNTGKYTGGANLEATVLKTNLEAATEIARQLRLRAIGGIIVVDFIDMNNEESKETLLQRLNEAFKADRCKARVYGVTGLGLVEITRKRARPDLRALMGRSCPFCSGTGWVEKEDSISMKVKKYIRKICASSKSEAMLIETHPAIAKYIRQTYLALWQEEFERIIYIVPDPVFPFEKYRMSLQGAAHQIETILKSRKN